MVPVQQVDLLVHLWFMTDPATIATHFRHVHFGGNWTCVNLRDTLKDVTWQEALHTREGFNSIAVLTYHIHYFVHAVLQVLEGGALDAHDTFSFRHVVPQPAWHDRAHALPLGPDRDLEEVAQG
jgi:hypothetical protein